MASVSTSTTRHQWGPAPSGSSQHVSVCRRCGLREVTEWYRAPDGDGTPDGAIEVTTWVTPTGAVVGCRRIDSHQGPPPSRPLAVLEGVADRPSDAVVQRCPGHPLGWAALSETLDA